MKNAFSAALPLLLVFIGISACTMTTPTQPPITEETGSNPTTGNRINIKVGSATFTATLLDNAAATAFNARSPLTLSMQELNGNEKFAQLPSSLPTHASNPGTIQTGDLMLYGSATLVLFYKTFPTSYSYTNLGRVDNPAGLAAALGSGNVTVTFDRK